jgi:UDPglucose 6-dehydrogenase
VRIAIADELRARNVAIPFTVVSNPEFLKEGAAVDDFMRPDRIVVGSDDPNAIAVLRSVYAPFQRSHERLLVMDVRSAELTKYAANAMLATRISFMNELANLAEHLGADIESVRHGIGSDPRIGYQFLYPGAGYGGSCFPKDVRALQSTARDNGITLKLLEAVEKVNEAQKHVLVDKMLKRLNGNIGGRRFAVWGLSFKPDTDDMREAPSRVIIDALGRRGAAVIAYDPVAMDEGRRIYKDSPHVSFASSPLAACEGADGLVIVTEWKEFRGQDLESVRAKLKQPLVFDGRNLYDPALARAAGIEYFSIGRS